MQLPPRHRLGEDGIVVTPHQEEAGGGIAVEGNDFLIFFVLNAMVQTDVHTDLIARGPALDRQQVGNGESHTFQFAAPGHNVHNPAQVAMSPMTMSTTFKLACQSGMLGATRGEASGCMGHLCRYAMILMFRL